MKHIPPVEMVSFQYDGDLSKHKVLSSVQIERIHHLTIIVVTPELFQDIFAIWKKEHFGGVCVVSKSADRVPTSEQEEVPDAVVESYDAAMAWATKEAGTLGKVMFLFGSDDSTADEIENLLPLVGSYGFVGINLDDRVLKKSPGFKCTHNLPVEKGEVGYWYRRKTEKALTASITRRMKHVEVLPGDQIILIAQERDTVRLVVSLVGWWRPVAGLRKIEIQSGPSKVEVRFKTNEGRDECLAELDFVMSRILTQHDDGGDSIQIVIGNEQLTRPLDDAAEILI